MITTPTSKKPTGVRNGFDVYHITIMIGWLIWINIYRTIAYNGYIKSVINLSKCCSDILITVHCDICRVDTTKEVITPTIEFPAKVSCCIQGDIIPITIWTNRIIINRSAANNIYSKVVIDSANYFEMLWNHSRAIESIRIVNKHVLKYKTCIIT